MKRLKMRYKIINEIVKTENTFLQDMEVLEEGYNALCFECSLITVRHKQTMFGRVKNVLSFTSVFYKELVGSAGCYLTRSEDEIVEARYQELLQWDAVTSIGDAFWSSVIPRESELSADGENRESLYWVLYTSRRGIADTTGARKE
jgi:RhoGEF domain